MDDKLIQECRDAYRAANPEKPSIDVQYQNGRYYVLHQDNPAKGLAEPYRKQEVVEMRDGLREWVRQRVEFGIGGA